MSSAQPSLLRQIMDIRREEWPQALLMATYFFLVITSFWILKPLKKSLFVGFYDQTGFDLLGWHMTAAQAELLAKVGNMLVALVAATAFAYLARSLRRQQLTYVFAGFSMVCYLVYSLLLTDPRGATVWTFYLYGDLFNTLMVPTFFAFLNDSVTTGQAKRLYGLVVLGGSVWGVRRSERCQGPSPRIQSERVDVDLPCHRLLDYCRFISGSSKFRIQVSGFDKTGDSTLQPEPCHGRSPARFQIALSARHCDHPGAL